MRRLSAGVILLLMVTAACVPPVENDKVIKFDPETTVMGRIQDAGVLRVGIAEGRGPFAADSDETSEGFTVEVAREVAGALGVEPEFLTGTDEELRAMVTSGEVDLAFPLTPITEDALSEHSFSDPYWVGHQKILAFDDAIQSVADLSTRSVCQSLDIITGVSVDELAPGIEELTEVDDLAVCSDVGAVVGPDVRLLGLLAGRGGTLLDQGLNTVGYGGMVTLENRAFASYVDEQIREAKDEGRWGEWFARYVSPLTGEDPDPPSMELEEAAALWPRD